MGEDARSRDQWEAISNVDEIMVANGIRELDGIQK